MEEKKVNTFYLKIVAADKLFFSGRARNLIIPSTDGEFSIMAHHEDMMAAVKIGEIRFQTEDGEWHAAVSGKGFAQAINNRVTLLVNFAERPEDIDVMRAREAKERAEEQMRQQQSIQEYYHTQASLSRAMMRLRVSGHNSINRK
ncbi:MAG: ATP synthase F1 subunit epsilon [Lachnospiraceae bacterium]|nr:ATP synthase F1 subunit epsilon [Lachnospiraceae bacterium]